MADKFAPGPWTHVGNSWQHTTIYDANQMPVCRLDLEDWGVDEDNQSELERRQSEVARRIAAAPALLDALVYIRSYLQERSDWPGTEPLMGDIDVAIAKATGEVQ